MADEGTQGEGVSRQIETLRRKLLDLTLRNRMLNFRPSKRLGVEVTGEDSFSTHLLLVEQSRRMTFVGVPDPPTRQASFEAVWDRTDAVAMEKARQEAEAEMDAFLINPVQPLDQLDNKLMTREFESLLQAKLRTVLREAKNANDELGINTLFLTLGILEWSESDARKNRAPLVFIPVKLEKLPGGSIRLVHDGSDPGCNLPLRAKLAELNLLHPELKEDQSLLDYFSEVESTVLARGWSVLRDEIHLGFFNYEKYAMYQDLGGEFWPDGRKPWQHPDSCALLGNGYAAIESPITEDSHLDEVRPLESSFEVYDADHSQTLAMIRAAEGHSMMIEGPPGTGKSQTITNIIAEAVANGKTVLFVSAKRAALEVVKRRLNEAELGPICLDLHDKLTNRKQFYAEIKRTIEQPMSVRDQEQKVARLREVREGLNRYAEATNEMLPPFETTPFLAMSRLSALPEESAEDREGRIPFDRIRHMTHADVEAARPHVRALQARVAGAGIPSEHAFFQCVIDSYDAGLKLDLTEELGDAETALSVAVEAATQAAAHFGLPLASVTEILKLEACASITAQAPFGVDAVDLQSSLWENDGQIQAVIDDLSLRQTTRKALESAVSSSIWAAPLAEEHQTLEKWAENPFRFISSDYRRSARTVESHLQPGADRSPQALRSVIRQVIPTQAADSRINAKGAEMRQIFGEHWRGLDSDPGELASIRSWVAKARSDAGSSRIPWEFLAHLSRPFDRTKDIEIANEAVQKSTIAAGGFAKVAALLGFAKAGDAIAEMHARVSRWRSDLPALPQWVSYAQARNQCLERGLAPVVDIADRWPLAAERLETALLRSWDMGVMREARETRPALKGFEREGHLQAIAEFQSLDDFKLLYNRAKVRLAHHRRLPRFDQAVGNLQLLKVQCELTRKHKPIRWVMARAGEAIQQTKPVFMMSPLSVAIHLPSELPLFDLVIFDEASQIKPEDAFSAIIRGRQTIVVGDTRQMPPTSFFDRLTDDEDDNDDLEDDVAAGVQASQLESILSLIRAGVSGSARRPDLQWHYRSLHPALIQPSNEMFYENRLVVFPSPGEDSMGIVFHHHPETIYEGGDGKRLNPLEAKVVADAVAEHIQLRPHDSLLVAAMNKAQADLIYREVQIRERQFPEAFARFGSLHPFEPLDVKNLENVQGDERDVVFLSVTYGRDAQGVIRQQFGPILRAGGERRLNVLITRARKRCEVFSNITADDLRTTGSEGGVAVLKQYLRFAQEGVLRKDKTTPAEAESPFEREVAEALRASGFKVDLQVGCEAYQLDMAVVDPAKPGRYALGVECDGANYHQARTARDRDKLRQRVLEARGWRLHRIWSTDWWQDREAEMGRLIAALEGDLSAVHVVPSQAPAASLVNTNVPPVQIASATRPYIQAVPIAGTNVVKMMIDVVRAEGPISRELLMIRLRDGLGYTNMSASLRSDLERALAERPREISEVDGGFYSNQEQLRVPRDWADRPVREKKPDLVPSAELAAALRAVVKASFGIARDQAVKAAYKLIGFARVSSAAKSRGETVLERLLDSGALIEVDGEVRQRENS